MDYRVWGAMLETYSKLKTKQKTIADVKKALQVIWGNLPDNMGMCTPCGCNLSHIAICLPY